MEKDRNIDTQARMVENLHEQPSIGVFTPVPDLSPTPPCRVRPKRKGRNTGEELVTNVKTNFVDKSDYNLSFYITAHFVGVCDVYSQTNQSVPLNIKELIINLNIEPASRFKNAIMN